MNRIAVIFVLALILANPVQAQDYRFSVPEAAVTVTVEPGGSALIHYKFTFLCGAGAHPIDVVDIGMPNVSPHTPGEARIDGRVLPSGSVRISSFLKPRGSGYEIQLGSYAIQPGETGVVEFTARESGMVWQDTTNPALASFRFTPTWFGSEYVVGSTMLTLRYILPIPEADYPAVKDQILWQRKGQDFNAKGVMEGEKTVSVAWVRNVQLTGKNEFGVSFPKKYIQSVRKDSLVALFMRWFEGNPDVQFFSGIAVLVALAFVFFVVTRGTGVTLFVIMALGLVYGMVQSAVFHLWMYPVVAALALLVWLLRNRRKRAYFPAALCREGGGLKRGLTAVEAAVLLEVPLNKVLTMIIFGMAKKGLVTVRTENPLTLEVNGAYRSPGVWKLGDGTNVKLWPYEQQFLKAFSAQHEKPVEAMKLDEPFDALIEKVVKAMEGFDLTSTREYYRSIVTRAWALVEAEGGYEARYERLDKHLDWLMLDEAWGRRLSDTTTGAPYYPRWWYGHSYRGASPAGGGGGLSLPSSQMTPSASFGDVANALTGRFEGLSARLAGSLDALSAAPKGGLDLSGVDRFTGEILKSLAESGGKGGGGGGGSGCACACAGCACACACAGGGR